MPSQRALCRLPLCLAPLWLAGCHLVDQRDFDVAAGRKPVPPAYTQPGPVAAPALVTIRYTTPDPQFREAVANAVQRALARRRDVLFTVTTLVPAQPGPEAQADQAAQAAGSGRAVAQAVVDGGAAPGQVEQAVRIQPGLDVREVLLTVH